MALLVVRAKGGYGGFTDRAIDLRVDDHVNPIVEMGRLLDIGLVNDLWNRGWTAFTEKKYAEARTIQERTATMAEKQPAVLPEVLYDLAVIRLAAGDPDGARKALDRAVALNPKLKAQAEKDPDLEKLR
jgi:tetratricopeptide (TPR) repeat protein